jgi:hypothetical protein
LASDLVVRRVAVIFAAGGNISAAPDKSPRYSQHRLTEAARPSGARFFIKRPSTAGKS